MVKLSRGGICYNLEVTPFFIKNKYEGYEVIFNFSSDFYKNKFKTQIDKHREKINESLSKRFGLLYINPILADIVLYSKVETRGFYLLINNKEFKCLSNIKLSGVNQIQKS